MEDLNRTNSFIKRRPFRVMVLGSSGVGKSALTVRFMTRRFIGDYDSSKDRVYQVSRQVGKLNVSYEIFDAVTQIYPGDLSNNDLKAAIRRYDAFIVMYSVDDMNSFDEAVSTISAIRKFRHGSRRPSDYSIALVGNKTDVGENRDVSFADGSNVAKCAGENVVFHEISVRESPEDSSDVFLSLYRKHNSKFTKTRSLPSLRRSPSVMKLFHSLNTIDDIETKAKSFTKMVQNLMPETPKFGRRGRYTF